ncbi:MAG: PepSY domain-containing protein [Nitrososphaerales archaeon]
MNKIQIGMPLSFVSLAALLVWYSITMTVHTASGQMMVGPNMMNNNMSWTTESGMEGENITGSINLMSTISKAIASEVKVGLSEAVATAEKSVGNASHAMAAHIGGDSGYLVYNVFVVDSNGKMHKIIIDPADRKILLSRELPRFESMMMMHQGMMMRGQRMMGKV